MDVKDSELGKGSFHMVINQSPYLISDRKRSSWCPRMKPCLSYHSYGPLRNRNRAESFDFLPVPLFLQRSALLLLYPVPPFLLTPLHRPTIATPFSFCLISPSLPVRPSPLLSLWLRGEWGLSERGRERVVAIGAMSYQQRCYQ